MNTPEDRRKHLEFIQAIIARQASHAFAIKGWSLTIAAALYAYTIANLSVGLAVGACLIMVPFAYLDAFYLRQERLFRELYRDAYQPDSTVTVYDMDTRRYLDPAMSPRCTYWSVLRSPSWWSLHLTTFALGLALVGVAIGKPCGA